MYIYIYIYTYIYIYIYIYIYSAPCNLQNSDYAEDAKEVADDRVGRVVDD